MKKNAKGVTAEKDEFSEWFTQIMMKAELAEYTGVSGAIVFRPGAYALWEKIQSEVDKRFKKLGIKNAYFPLLIPEKSLAKESEHVEGFTPEVAWVTYAGNTKLSERLAVRPTSEAIMYESYSKWIRSWRDLPLKLNQWNNVVRWEFKHPVPFLRTREFLWNEGHTVFASEDEALAEGPKVMKIYQEVCEEFLGLYGVLGRKTEKEKFAGAVFSEKIHYVMPNGKAIEGPAFHHDGQNFARAYDIKFLNKKGKEELAWQNTFAITTRMLGVMFAVHSDDKGLVLPPEIAVDKVVIVPILFEDSKAEVLKVAKDIQKKLGVGVILDDREEHKPGFKFNEWEMKGVPLRIEIGPKDIGKGTVVLVRRDDGEKELVKIGKVKARVEELLDEIQENLFVKSKKLWEGNVVHARNMPELKKMIDKKKIVVVPLAAGNEVEEDLKFKTGGAKTLFVSEEELKGGERCVVSGEKADYFVYVGKSY